MSKILTFGEIIWDVYEDARHIGGAGLNFAAHAARCGAESYLLSAVGEDALGNAALDELAAFGVDASLVMRTGKQTGVCHVTLDGRGLPSYRVERDVAYDNIPLTDETVTHLRQKAFDALCFGTLVQRAPLSRASLRRLCEEVAFKEIVCDVNLREGCYDRDSILFCLTHATVLKVSDEEEPILREMGLYKCRDARPHTIAIAIAEKYKNVKTVLLTCGAKGCLCYSAETKTAFFKKAEPVTVASTVGAGDSFSAAFVTARLSGHSAEDSTRFASLLSGFVVSHTEAVPVYTVRNGRIGSPLPLFDSHTHSNNSHDGKSTVAEMAEAFMEKGAAAFAVTDHCDLHAFEEQGCDGHFAACARDVEAAREKYGDKIKILFGVEIGEGTMYPEEMKEFLSHYDFDVIIGSVHLVNCKGMSEYTAQIDFSKPDERALDEYISLYFDEVMEMLRATPCHVMAHLTLPVRYINRKYGRGISLAPYAEKIREILSYIIAHGIALEINTSGDGYFMPDEEIVKEFKKMGGTLVTLGSDAHQAKNAAKDFDRAIAMLKHAGLTGYYYFEKGKPVRCEI